MEQTLKQRLVGAAVIIAVGVIVIPMILDGAGERQLRKMPDAPKARIHSKPGLVTEESVPISSVGETGQIVLTLPEDTAANVPERGSETPAVSVKKEPKSEPKPEPKPIVTSKVAEPVKSSPESKPKIEPKPKSRPVTKEVPKTKSIESAEKKATAKAEEKPTESVSPTGIWVVQVGSFTDAKKAFKFRDNLRAKKYKAFVEKIRGRSGKSLYRVRIGPMAKREQADNMAAELKQKAIKGFVTRHP